MFLLKQICQLISDRSQIPISRRTYSSMLKEDSLEKSHFGGEWGGTLHKKPLVLLPVPEKFKMKKKNKKHISDEKTT